MPFVEPMLASPMPEGFSLKSGDFSAEIKVDGHRLIISVAENGANLFGDTSVQAWSRNGIPRILPPRIRLALEILPSGIYDGELMMPGKQSTSVTVVEDSGKLELEIFDAIELLGKDMRREPYTNRRACLEVIFQNAKVAEYQHVLRIVQSQQVNSMDDVVSFRNEVWAKGGEGLILKRNASLYFSGRRSKDWIKVKQLRSALMILVGYRAGEMGPRSVLVFRDSEGALVPVKWKNLEMLEALKTQHQAWLGRQAAIEFQMRADDGGYRHPRFDHWEE